MPLDNALDSRGGGVPLHSVATGRTGSLFTEDMAVAMDRLRDAVASKRVLAIGGAGSIGSSTVFQLAALRPHTLHVVDQNENGLAELVRQLRSRPQSWHATDFQSLPLDYGSPAMGRFLAEQPAYDLVLNFAALKHVRSEKDPFSLLQMFETNLVKQARLMEWLRQKDFSGRFFTVSTDKAANPSSMMGASKRVMEHVLFNSGIARALGGTKTSARFANVAFSNGSLLQSFENRLRLGEPLAAPRDTLRYFVSLQESGEICSIASILAEDRTMVVPKLRPDEHLVPMVDVATRFLALHGFEPAIYDDEAAACASVETERLRGRWPLLATALDTSGEKPYEEFSTDEETVRTFGMPNLQAVDYLPAPQDAIDTAIRETIALLDSASGPLSRERLRDVIAIVEPAFAASHRSSALNLDQRL